MRGVVRRIEQVLGQVATPARTCDDRSLNLLGDLTVTARGQPGDSVTSNTLSVTAAISVESTIAALASATATS